MAERRLLSFPPIPPGTTSELQLWLQMLQENLTVDLYSALQGVIVAVDELPAPSEMERGRLVFLKSPSGVADSILVCRKNASDSYEWVVLA